MTTKKTPAKPAAAPRKPAPAEEVAAQTFERSLPAAPRLRLSERAASSGIGTGSEEDLLNHGSAAPEGGTGQAEVSPRDLILRLVEALKGL